MPDFLDHVKTLERYNGPIGGVRRFLVESSNVVAVGYDLDLRMLVVEFVGGSVYGYFDVGEDAAVALLTAESVGKYLNAHIKPVYEFRQLCKTPVSGLVT